MGACPRCSTMNPAAANFCNACGEPLPAVGRARGESRRTVTVLFCDVTGFTSLAERLDPETLRPRMDRYFAVAREIIERHEGTVEKFIGDAVMAVFGVPQLHEDDALRGLRAAAELRDRIAEEREAVAGSPTERLQVRIGIATGEVLASSAHAGEAYVTGDAVNVAARLQQAADPGDVFLSEATRAIVGDAARVEEVGELDLKGKVMPTRAYRLLEVSPVTSHPTRPARAPLIARESELAQLQGALERSVRDHRPYLFTLIGAPGVGKSRLVSEFITTHAGRVLTGRCLPYGSGITYWPIAEVVRQAIGAGPDELAAAGDDRLAERLSGQPDGPLIANRLSATLGWSDAEISADDSDWAVRQFLEFEARREPLVVIVDDIQWAALRLLDLIEHVADWARAPILLVCIARPDLLDLRATWGGGKVNATTMLLQPLTAQATMELVGRLLGTRGHQSVPDRILKVAEGVPLFVEQIVGHMALDQGEDVPIEVPRSVQALLAARIDALAGGERAIVGAASVVGEEFSRDQVLALVDPGLRDQVDELLRVLMRRELVRPDGAAGSDESYRFSHVLIRDAAYDAIPKAERASLHQRFADWLGALPNQAGDLQEIAGAHLEMACDYLSDLGEPVDVSLAQRASETLAAAARRAARRRDHSAAAELMSRAMALSPSQGRDRMELQLETIHLLLVGDQMVRAAAMADELVGQAATAGARALEYRARVFGSWARRSLDPANGVAEQRELLATALGPLMAEGDEQGLTAYWAMAGDLAYFDGRIADALAALDEALRHEARAPDPHARQRIRAQRLARAAEGAEPLGTLLPESRAQLADADPGSLAYAVAATSLASLLALSGTFDEAERLLDDAAAIHGGVWSGAWQGERESRANLERLRGNLDAAERHLREFVEYLVQVGERYYGSTYIALLAGVIAEIGDGRQAEVLRLVKQAHEMSEISDDWWIDAIGAQARALVTPTAHDALSLAREAVELAEAHEIASMRTDALVVLGTVLARDGQTGEARSAFERASAIARDRGAFGEEQRAERISRDLGL